MSRCEHKFKILEKIEGKGKRFFFFPIRMRTTIIQCTICGDIGSRITEIPEKEDMRLNNG